MTTKLTAKGMESKKGEVKKAAIRVHLAPLSDGQMRAICHRRTSISNQIIEKERELTALRDELVALERSIILIERTR